MLGYIGNGSGTRVTVEPEQWENHKCYGMSQLTKLQHFLQINLYGPDGKVVYSYRDFCFGMLKDELSNMQLDCQRDIYKRAQTVVARIKMMSPDFAAEVVTEPPQEGAEKAAEVTAQ